MDSGTLTLLALGGLGLVALTSGDDEAPTVPTAPVETPQRSWRGWHNYTQKKQSGWWDYESYPKIKPQKKPLVPVQPGIGYVVTSENLGTPPQMTQFNPRAFCNRRW